MKNDSRQNLRLSVISALFAALSAVFVYFFHIPNVIGGYIHIGDAIIYLCASVLPVSYAATAGAVGFAIADLLSGYPYYMLPSAIIRVIVVLLFTSKREKIVCKRNIIALPFAVIITTGLYALTKYVLYYFIQNMPEIAGVKALASIPGNIIQCTVSSVLYIAVSIAMDKLDFKKKYFGG